jgi:hypothetical protein
MWIEIAVLLGFGTAITGSGGFALPQKLDIPANFSTVICADEHKARSFFNDHIASNANGTDLQRERFFEGLTVTGCFQGSGPLQIKEVLARKSVVWGQTLGHILYRATGPSGETVFGIVNEIGNNSVPRTPFEEWLSLHTQDGILMADLNEKLTYVCSSPQAAQAAVATLSRAKRNGVKGNQLKRAKASAFRTSGCMATQGRFRVRNVHRSIAVYFGEDAESMEDWTAITALNSRSQVIGLLHNSSLL